MYPDFPPAITVLVLKQITVKNVKEVILINNDIYISFFI